MVNVVLGLKSTPDSVTLDTLRTRIGTILNLKPAEVRLVTDIGNPVHATESRVTITDHQDQEIPSSLRNTILYHFLEVMIVIS